MVRERVERSNSVVRILISQSLFTKCFFMHLICMSERHSEFGVSFGDENDFRGSDMVS